MIAKILYLVAVIIFVVMAIAHPDPGNHLLEWGLASIAAGLLLEGIGPGIPVTYRRP